MSIQDVVELQQLRKTLLDFTWRCDNALEAISFVVLNDNCLELQHLDVHKRDLLKRVMCGVYKVGVLSFSSQVGTEVKKIAISRCDFAIKLAAKEARADAEAVLNALNEVNE